MPEWLTMLRVVLLVMVVCTGCSLGKTKIALYDRPRPRPSFSELEITAKSWNLGKARSIQFLEWSMVPHKLRGVPGELIIAKYGDKNTGEIKLLEFYRPLEKLTADSRQEYFLVNHDSRFDKLISLKTECDKDGVRIEIRRESAPDSSLRRKRTYYVLCYDKTFRIQPSMSELTF